MRNVKEMSFVLLPLIIVGFLITISLNFGNIKSSMPLNAVEYKNATEQRNRLYKEIENIKEENIDYMHKINQYRDNDPKKNEKLIEDMKKQLIDYSSLSGSIKVKGPGVMIKVQDGDMDRNLDSDIEILRKIFHEDDMSLILNELRKAGAETISVNDHRILPNTGVKCQWVLIGFEDQSRTSAPFYIYAIGDPEKMKASLLAEDSYIQKLILRKLKVEIEVKDEIIIPPTNQNTEVNYMKRYEEK